MLEFIRYGIPAYVQGTFHSIRNRQEGQALVEYALILGLASILSVVVLQAIGTNVVGKLAQVRDAFV